MPAVVNTPAHLIEKLKHPTLRAFYDYWQDLAAKHGLPGRQHVDPWTIRALLPWLFMLDVVVPPPWARFRFRLAGTAVVQLYGGELTGKTLLEALPDRAEQLTARCSEIVTSRQPAYHSCNLAAESQSDVTVEHLICPLAKDGRTVNMLIGVTCPGPDDPKARKSAA